MVPNGALIIRSSGFQISKTAIANFSKDSRTLEAIAEKGIPDYGPRPGFFQNEMVDDLSHPNKA